MPGFRPALKLLFVGFLLLSSQPLQARVFRLAAGTNLISEALKTVTHGDTLMLISDGGVYHESSWVALRQTSLTILAAPSLHSPPIWTTSGSRHIRAYGDLSVRGIHFEGNHKVDYAIRSYAPQPNDLLVIDCTFSNILKDAITDDDVPLKSCRVFNSRFFNIQGVGIEFKNADMCYNLEVANCTFANMGEHAIHIEEKDVPLKVRISNITVHNSTAGVHFNNISGAMLTRSILTGSRSYAVRSTLPASLTYICTFQNAKDYDDVSPGTGCLRADPLYLDPDASNFVLLPGSPCLTTPEGVLGDMRWTGPGALQALRLKRLQTWGFNLALLLLAIGLVGGLGYGIYRQTLIGERKRLETQIRQSQKLQTLGHLAGGIAHDFNNLISIIHGNAELIAEMLPQESKIRPNIQKILNAASHSQDLVTQLTAFNSGDEPKHRPTDLAALMEDALLLLQPVLPNSVRLQKKIATDVAPVLADPTQVNQVVLNLCLNAKDAMAEAGGRLAVSLDTAYLEPQIASQHKLSPGHYARIGVEDTGPGMTRQVQKHIFEPFFTTKPEDEGTGLGLSVVQSVIIRHSGAIAVSSQPGKGTTFYVYLPFAPATDAPAREGQISARILFIDDEADLAKLTKSLLEQQGHHVISKTDSREALAIFQDRSGQFDIIVTDYLMPNLDGGELIHRIKAIRPDIPVILVTGLHTQINAQKAAQMGFEAFLAKPQFSKDLGGVIQEILHQTQN